MVALALAAAAAFLVPALALKPTQLFTLPYVAHVVLCTLSGLFRGALDPLFFEMSTELAFVEVSLFSVIYIHFVRLLLTVFF